MPFGKLPNLSQSSSLGFSPPFLYLRSLATGQTLDLLQRVAVIITDQLGNGPRRSSSEKVPSFCHKSLQKPPDLRIIGTLFPGIIFLLYRALHSLSPSEASTHEWTIKPLKLILPGEFHYLNLQNKNLKATGSVAFKATPVLCSIPVSAGVGLHGPGQRGVQFCHFGLELRHCKYLPEVNLHWDSQCPQCPSALYCFPWAGFPQGSLLKVAEGPWNHSPFPLADS